MVPRGRIELPTPASSGLRSTNELPRPIGKNQNFHNKKHKSFCSLLRSPDSNREPSGYEPDELPLLYSAIFITQMGEEGIGPSTFPLSEECSTTELLAQICLKGIKRL